MATPADARRRGNANVTRMVAKCGTSVVQTKSKFRSLPACNKGLAKKSGSINEYTLQKGTCFTKLASRMKREKTNADQIEIKGPKFEKAGHIIENAEVQVIAFLLIRRASSRVSPPHGSGERI